MVISVLLSLLVFCVLMYVAFWLLGIATATLPPPLRAAILAICAIIALIYLFGGYAPWWGGHFR
jgi:hypothetical protein